MEKRNRSNVWAAIILGISLIICSIVLAAGHRYEPLGNNKVLDKWTGNAYFPDYKKVQ